MKRLKLMMLTVMVFTSLFIIGESRMLTLLQELNNQGKTIILVTHDEAIKQQGKRLVEIG